MNTVFVINALIQMLHASEQGFRTAESSVESPELKSTFHECTIQRGKFLGELDALLRSIDDTEAPQRVLVNDIFDTRSLWGPSVSQRDDLAVVGRCEHAEEAAVAFYERALRQPGNPDHAIDIFHDQYLKVRASRERIQSLREAMAESCAPLACAA